MDSEKPLKIASISRNKRYLSNQSKKIEIDYDDSVTLEYKNFIENFKSSKKKKNYSFSLVSKIEEVQKYYKGVKEHTKNKIKRKPAEKKAEIEENKTVENNEIKKEKEKEEKTLKAKKKSQEIAQKELLKKQSLQEWMQNNYEIFEQKKQKIKDEIEETKRLQRENIEKSEVKNRARYEDILKAREEGRRISLGIIEVDSRKNDFLKEIERRDASEVEETLEVSVVEQIREKLKNSQVVNDIINCFGNSP